MADMALAVPLLDRGVWTAHVATVISDRQVNGLPQKENPKLILSPRKDCRLGIICKRQLVVENWGFNYRVHGVNKLQPLSITGLFRGGRCPDIHSLLKQHRYRVLLCQLQLLEL